MVRTVTWTRESHGLFDFEGTEIVRKQFKIKGSHRFFRKQNEVEASAADRLDVFETQEVKMEQDHVDNIIARTFYNNGQYWIYHKNHVD